MKNNKKVNFDEFVEDYDELLNENTAFFAKDDSYFAKYKIDLMSVNISSSPLRILEYGSGTGRNIPFIIEKYPNAEVYAFDISQESLKVINESLPNVKTFFEITEFNNYFEYFDLIYIAGVYHHIAPELREDVTAGIYRMLKSGGELFVFEHNPYNFVTKKLVENCIYDADAILVKPFELKDLLLKASFKYSLCKYYLFFPPVTKLQWVEKYMHYIPLGGQYMVKMVK
jgi:SAM-dependent methyltransferase